MFADTAKVSLKAGKGGDGAVSFRHEIYVPKGGPDGGDGGRGGNIIFRADKDTNTLVDFRFTPILVAENGKNGAGQRAAGRSGRDLILEVPIGTLIYRVEDQPGEMQGDAKGDENIAQPQRVLLADLTEDGQEAIIARGGEGGYGNAHFKSSTRQTPTIAEVGEPGEEFAAELELRSVADVGLVGLPNAGKSTFLSVVSNARPEIADYPFTTLIPNLGVATVDGRDILIADIPGLIEGAAEGKGLGHDFLRHVERTAVLLHLVDVYNNDAGAAYQTIRDELARYEDLAERPEVVALTKCEGVDEEIIAMQTAAILARNPEAQVLTISSAAHQGLTELLRELKSRVEDKEISTGKLKAGQKAQNMAEIAENQQKTLQNDQNWTKNAEIPTISLSPKALKDVCQVEEGADGKFLVRGEKIEKFARRTDFDNYASVNRLRDIMKKMGIRAELTTRGAQPDSIIEIAGKEFTLVEQ